MHSIQLQTSFYVSCQGSDIMNDGIDWLGLQSHIVYIKVGVSTDKAAKEMTGWRSWWVSSVESLVLRVRLGQWET